MNEQLAEALAASANPEQAHASIERLAERNPEGRAALGAEGLRRLAVLAGASAPLGHLVATSPDALALLASDLAPLDAATVAERCRAALQRVERPATALAAVQRLGLLNAAARDLLGLAGTPQVAAELADLAQGVLTAALEQVSGDADVRLAVVAMGKLGGCELNYVSDVDVVFACEGDWTAATRVASAFLRLLGEVTPEGRAYQVDPNLRPEGKDGPLVRSIDAYRSYYQRWAKTWEYQALLKARPVAGDDELGRAFVAMAAPFVWPDRLDARAVEEIQRLKAVVEGSAEIRRTALRPAGAAGVRRSGRDVKLAPGGLRDIEFAVQLLQLVHGRHDPTLRSPNTLEALAALSHGAYVGRQDAADFSDAYAFLRTVEHRLQLAHLRRTHTLPPREQERRRLARSLGFDDSPERDALEHFDAELRRVQGLTRTLHAKLFYRPLLSRFAELGAAEQLGTGDGERLAEDAARERLQALGFRHPDGALGHLHVLAGGVTRRAHMFRTMLPAMLPTLAAAPDPDGGLAALRWLAERTDRFPHLVRTLRDNPPVADTLATVLGSSSVVGGWLERQPEVIGLLADADALGRRLEAGDYARLAAGLRRRGEDAEGTADALRRLRRREAARIAVRDLTRLADVVDVAVELSGLAEACLQAAVELVVPDGLRLAVIGLGKLGGSELGYASDLDVLLVFEPGEARGEAERAGEALLRLLSGITPEGQAFHVDPNLRPEGKDGPLARSLGSYRAYYERWGEPWELQALTQARHVAGDRVLGRAFVASLADLVYPPALPDERLSAMRRMKARVERERAGPARPRGGARMRRGGDRARVRRDGDGERTDLKVGHGGLADIEWTVQLLQLRHGGQQRSVRRPGTLAALRACVAEGVLDGRDGDWLAHGWRFLTRLRNALYLAGLRDTGRLPARSPDQERVARMLGYPAPGAQALTEDLARVLRRNRKIHERLFYAASR